MSVYGGSSRFLLSQFNLTNSRESKTVITDDVILLEKLQRPNNCVLSPTQQTASSAACSLCGGKEEGKKKVIFLLMQKENENGFSFHENKEMQFSKYGNDLLHWRPSFKFLP